MDTALFAPLRQALSCVVDEPLVEPLRHQAVVGECLQFGGAMASAPSPRKQALHVDGVVRSAAPLVDDPPERPPFAGTNALHLLQQGDEFG